MRWTTFVRENGRLYLGSVIKGLNEKSPREGQSHPEEGSHVTRDELPLETRRVRRCERRGQRI